MKKDVLEGLIDNTPEENRFYSIQEIIDNNYERLLELQCMASDYQTAEDNENGECVVYDFFVFDENRYAEVKSIMDYNNESLNIQGVTLMDYKEATRNMINGRKRSI